MPTILIVEDETLVGLFLADLLEELGYQVIGPAATIADAISAAKQDPPDIAIIDMTLASGESGIKAAHALVGCHNLSLIFISGHADVKSSQEIQNLHPIAVLQKPCRAAQLKDALAATSLDGQARKTDR